MDPKEPRCQPFFLLFGPAQMKASGLTARGQSPRPLTHSVQPHGSILQEEVTVCVVNKSFFAAGLCTLHWICGWPKHLGEFTSQQITSLKNF